MTEPTQKVRKLVYRRDGNRCIVCGSPDLSFQHRQAVGMGGSKVKPAPHEGLAMCVIHNSRCESDMQAEALRYGWKVKRFTPVPVASVPVLYPLEVKWFLLNADGSRDALSPVNADELRALAGILPTPEGIK